MSSTITIRPIGFVRGGRGEPVDDAWDAVEARIELDAIDGTPVLDIKPVMTGFLPRGDIREPDWARELMRDYW
jgi:tRNA (Thr-GGU) A37 N-methylase